jgi:isopenicillin N synthase-like dioxygenase
MMDSLDVVVDISSLLSIEATTQEKQKTANEIDHACREFGFFYITSPLISQQILENAFLRTKEFFLNSSQDQKETLSMRDNNQHRGYFGIGDENVVDSGDVVVLDVKEGFHIGLEPHLYRTKHDFAYAENHWPKWLDNREQWKQAMQDYFDLMLRISKALMRGFALALNKEEHFFDAMFEEPLALLRLLHYPPLSSYPQSQGKLLLGCGEHTDYGFLSILMQDLDHDALQILHNGTWIRAPPIKNTLVVNIGDAMEICTNALYKATPHRVILSLHPSPRFSLPFFFEPNYDAILERIIHVEQDVPTKGIGMKFGEYLKSRLASTHVYIKDQNN